MAIQVRRGANADFDASKMLPGELAVTTDGSRKVYAAFQEGDVKELAFKEDVRNIVDDTLTVSGKAADAAAVGKKVTELNEKIVEETGKLSGENDYLTARGYATSNGSIFGAWEMGTIQSDGSLTDNDKRYRTVTRIKAVAGMTISIKEGYKFSIVAYDAEIGGSVISVSGWQTEMFIVKADCWIAVLFAVVDDSSIRDYDIDTLRSHFSVNRDVYGVVHEVAAVKKSVDELAGKSIIAPSTVSAGYKITSNGSCLNDAGCKLIKYAVTAGESVYLDATKDGVTTAQFQTVASVPYTTNPNIVGDMIVDAFCGYLTVPEGAKYLIISAYSDNTVSGLYEFTLKSDIEKLKSDVASIMPDAETLPDYWLTYLENKLDEINAAKTAVAIGGDCFSFFTDYHINSNQRHTSKILRFIREHTGISFDVFGGDALTNHAKTAALDYLNQFAAEFDHDGFFPIVGNHEKNPYGPSSADDALSDNDIYWPMFKRLEKNAKVRMGARMYYYIDNSAQRLRYIFLNTDTTSDGSDFTNDAEQIQWLDETLNSIPAGWFAVIFTHIFYNSISDGTGSEAWYSGKVLHAVVTAYQNKTSYTSSSAKHTFDFTNAKGGICCIITGHAHVDFAEQDESGYPIIATVCDTNQAQQNGPNDLDRTTGTVNEQAIDLFFVSTTDRTIKTIRIGAGENREFAF